MRARRKSTTYIYHVIGTLEWRHIRASLESLRRQCIHWERFVLFNHSDWPTERILELVPRIDFDEVSVYAIPADLPPTSTADWDEQMRGISGTDRYLSHKADFFLADGVCEALDTLEGDEWFVLFSKFDMKERATRAHFRALARCTWVENCFRSDVTDQIDDHRGKLAVAWMGRPDGTMHAYTDGVRALYQPSASEKEMRWGENHSIRALAEKVPFVLNGQFFALHMWHDTPDRQDPQKQIPGERF